MDKRTITGQNLRLVVLLYELMRDHIPAGVLHEIISSSNTDIEGKPLHTVDFSNEYLAGYAAELAAVVMAPVPYSFPGEDRLAEIAEELRRRNAEDNGA